MADPKIKLGERPAHWGLNFTQNIHSQPTESINPAKVSFPDGYTVVVVGAGKGVGEHTAKAYVQADASNIIITSRTSSDLKRVKGELETLAKQNGRVVNVVTLVQDASNPENYIEIKDLLESDFGGRLDCLICSAGGPLKPLFTSHINETRTDEWNDSIALNFLVACYAAKHLVPLMLRPQSRGKAIVNISSVASHSTDGHVTPAPYSIGKLALNRFTQSLGENYKDQGLVAVAVNPGSTATPGAMELVPPAARSRLTDDQGLCGAVCVWISKERKEWISGRYVSAKWDMDELEAMKDEIVEKDKLKWRMVV